MAQAKDLEKLSMSELDALIERAQSVRSTTRERRRAALRAEVEEMVEKEGFTVSELFGRKLGGRGASRGDRPKYRNPDNPGETWMGKGKRPKWLTAKLDAGARLEDFLAR